MGQRSLCSRGLPGAHRRRRGRSARSRASQSPVLARSRMEWRRSSARASVAACCQCSSGSSCSSCAGRWPCWRWFSGQSCGFSRCRSGSSESRWRASLRSCARCSSFRPGCSAADSDGEPVADASTVEVIPVSVADPAARACLDRYFDELAARFPEGFTRPSRVVAALDRYSPPAGAFLLARTAGNAVGCAALRLCAPGVGEIKHMWVSPEARGHGVGRMLLAAVEYAARGRHLRALRLDTHSALLEALRLYRTSGYREIPRFNDNPYAHHWFEKALD